MPETPSSPGMSAANLFSAVTCVSFILSISLALIFEGKILYKLSNNVIQDISNEPRSDNEKKTIVLYILISGLFHYLNNEVMYLVLSNVHPITLAVGNTMKRVFIIVAGVLVFATPVTLQTGIGSVIAIGGVFLYGMMKQWYESSTRGSGAIGNGVCGSQLN
jgi:solute carrier family 35 protein E1